MLLVFFFFLQQAEECGDSTRGSLRILEPLLLWYTPLVWSNTISSVSIHMHSQVAAAREALGASAVVNTLPGRQPLF